MDLQEIIERLGLIRNTTIRIDVSREGLINYLQSITTPQKESVKSRKVPCPLPYFGQIGWGGFEVKENVVPDRFGSSASLIGTFVEHRGGITLNLQSHYLPKIAYHPIIVGLVVMLGFLFHFLTTQPMGSNLITITLLFLAGIFCLYFWLKHSVDYATKYFLLNMETLFTDNPSSSSD